MSILDLLWGLLGFVAALLLLDMLLRSRLQYVKKILERHELAIQRLRGDKIRLEHKVNHIQKVRRIK